MNIPTLSPAVIPPVADSASEPPPPALVVEHAHVRYAGSTRHTVQDLSFTLQQGDIGVLLGPSGCGKTTLLRALAGLEALTSGVIAMHGVVLSQDSRTVPPEQRRMGMVFQDHALFPHMTVARNIAFGLHRASAEQQRQRVQAMLEMVGLADLGERYPHELSGGQQQRVALARALAPEPQLLLLDEPFSSLDTSLRERLAQELRDILKAARITAILVTHDQQEAFALGDRIGVMQQGQLHQWADAATLYHQPATPFVAQFIGQGILLDAQHDPSTAAGVIRTALGELPLSPAQQQALPAGQVQMLVRADDVVHDAASPVQAQVLRRAFNGATIRYTLQLADGSVVQSVMGSHHDYAVGSAVGIRPDMQHVVVFADSAVPSESHSNI